MKFFGAVENYGLLNLPLRLDFLCDFEYIIGSIAIFVNDGCVNFEQNCAKQGD